MRVITTYLRFKPLVSRKIRGKRGGGKERGRKRKEAGRKREIDLMFMQCGLVNSRMNWGTKLFNSVDFDRYSKKWCTQLAHLRLNLLSQLAFVFSPLWGQTAGLIPDRALLAACFLTGPRLLNSCLEELEKINNNNLKNHNDNSVKGVNLC